MNNLRGSALLNSTLRLALATKSKIESPEKTRNLPQLPLNTILPHLWLVCLPRRPCLSMFCQYVVSNVIYVQYIVSCVKENGINEIILILGGRGEWIFSRFKLDVSV